MKFEETELKGAYIIHLEPFTDHRGMFARLFCKNEFQQISFNKEFVQANYSLTNKKGCVRGMHYQIPPKVETKLIRCISGSVYDVFIDLRKDSPTFLKYHGEVLRKDDLKMLLIPEGFAHGFQALEDDSALIYFVSSFYDKESERGVRYNDPLVNIQWPLKIADISEKDKKIDLLKEDFLGISL